MFEVTEGEQIHDAEHLKRIFAEYGKQGFTTAIDDFGAGYSGLNLLAEFQPHVLKLDMALIRGIDQSKPRRAIVAGVVAMCRQLDIAVIAEGIESADEARCLADLGIHLMQGYWFGRPQLERAVDETDIAWTL